MLDSVSVILPQNMSLYFPVRILCWGISMKEYVLLCTRTNVRVKSQGIESARSILITRMCLVLSGFEGNFGVHHVTPRNLSSSLVNKLVSLHGIVTKCSLVQSLRRIFPTRLAIRCVSDVSELFGIWRALFKIKAYSSRFALSC